MTSTMQKAIKGMFNREWRDLLLKCGTAYWMHIGLILNSASLLLVRGYSNFFFCILFFLLTCVTGQIVCLRESGFFFYSND